jgi:hypothetical protein
MLRSVALVALPLLIAAALAATVWQGPAGGAGVVVAGGVALADFVAILWVVTRLADPASIGAARGGLGGLLVLKLFAVGFGLWLAIVSWRLPGEGVTLGLLAATLGFTVSQVVASRSREGEAQMSADEADIAAALEAQRAATARAADTPLDDSSGGSSEPPQRGGSREA